MGLRNWVLNNVTMLSIKVLVAYLLSPPVLQAVSASRQHQYCREDCLTVHGKCFKLGSRPKFYAPKIVRHSYKMDPKNNPPTKNANIELSIDPFFRNPNRGPYVQNLHDARKQLSSVAADSTRLFASIDFSRQQIEVSALMLLYSPTHPERVFHEPYRPHYNPCALNPKTLMPTGALAWSCRASISC